MNEEWRPVSGFEGWYSVSNLGRVRRDDRLVAGPHGSTRRWRGGLLNITCPQIKGRGRRYPMVTLWRDSSPTSKRVHDLVAEAFIGPKPECSEVLHWNDIPTDNRLANLRYGTHAENGSDTTRNRLTCKHGHEFTESNTYFRKDTGKRQCLACMKNRNDSRPRKTTATRRRKTSLPQHEGITS